MNHYCIVYKGVYNEWYSYLQMKDINQLAKYLNDKVMDRNVVMNVYLTDNIESGTFTNRCFFQSEYDNQYFIDNYEERILEKSKLEILAI